MDLIHIGAVLIGSKIARSKRCIDIAMSRFNISVARAESDLVGAMNHTGYRPIVFFYWFGPINFGFRRLSRIRGGNYVWIETVYG